MSPFHGTRFSACISRRLYRFHLGLAISVSISLHSVFYAPLLPFSPDGSTLVPCVNCYVAYPAPLLLSGLTLKWFFLHLLFVHLSCIFAQWLPVWQCIHNRLNIYPMCCFTSPGINTRFEQRPLQPTCCSLVIPVLITDVHLSMC